MQCEIYSKKYKTNIEFWNHGGEIKVRSAEYIPELPELHFYEGHTLCEGGCLRGGVYSFYHCWDYDQFKSACRIWWGKFMRRVDG